MPQSRVRKLIKGCQHEEAERLLDLILKENPGDQEAAAELGLLYCFTQREFQALELLDRCSECDSGQELKALLEDHFVCRRMMAQKLGVEDQKGAAAFQRLGNPAGREVGIKLTACLIVKNEEKVLERCLISVQAVCDEIVVVDTGSTDRTVEIAARFGAKVGSFEWCDDFAAARNASLDHATGDWVLWIDADEELTADSVNAIREALIRPHFAGYFIRILNLMDEGSEANQYVHTPVRLFRRLPQIRFEGRIHEQILQAFEEHGFLAATLTNATIKHYGYQPEAMREKDKLSRTIGMLEREVREHPSDPFHWFNLANAYSVARRPEDAERAARLCINFISHSAPYAPVAFQILTSALIAQDRADEALEVCEIAQCKEAFSVINEFDRAHALFKLGRNEQALSSIDACLAMEWPADLTGDFAIKTYKGQVLRSQILTKLGRAQEGLELAKSALLMDPSFGIAHYAKGCACSALGNHAEAAAAFVQASGYPGLENCIKLAIRELVSCAHHLEAVALCEGFLASYPEDAEVLSTWLKALEAIGDLPRLRSAYETALTGGVVSGPLLINYGRVLDSLGEIDGALLAFEEAANLRLEPNAFLNAGDVLYRHGRYQEAAEKYEQALKLDATNPQAWFVLGNCFARMGVAQGAQLAYWQTLNFDPGHREAKANLDLVAA